MPANAKARRAAGAFLASATFAWCVWRGVRTSKDPAQTPRGRKTEEDPPEGNKLPDPVLITNGAVERGRMAEGASPTEPGHPQITRLPEIPVNLLLKAPPRRRSRAFVISLLLHCCLVWLLTAGLDVEEEEWKEPAPRLSVHLLVLTPPVHPPEKSSTPRDAKATAQSIGVFPKWPVRPAPTRGAQDAEPEGENGSEQRAFTLPPLARAKRDEHTLVQPDIPPEILPRENMKVPEALIWAEQEARNLLIVPGSSSPARFPDVRPVVDVAAPEVRRPDIAVRATPAIVTPELPVPRAPASPARMALPEPDMETGVPQTLSNEPGETSAGHLISVADISLPPDARIVVPSVSQVAALKNPEAKNVQAQPADNRKGAGAADGTEHGGDRLGTMPAMESAAKAPGAGAGAASDSAGSSAQKNADSRNVATGRSPATESSGVQSSGGQPANGTGANAQSAITLYRGDFTRISRPPNGRHASVVLGAQPSAAYPESAGVLTGKIVYTVYLQLELRKNWILQFCLSGTGSPQTQPNGGVPAIDAPWPYTMVRPPMEGLSGDYTLVHGFVNATGHFERLSLVIPDNSTRDLLEALQQWEFRPASRDGSPVAVEILLILPHPQE